jgi:hypothetical protein
VAGSDEADWITFHCSASFGLGTDLGVTCTVDVDMVRAFEEAAEAVEKEYEDANEEIDDFVREVLFWESIL